MIERLRKRFIKIATIAVALVLLLLSLIVNVVNFISVDRDLTEKLTTIEENQGTMPTGKKQEEEPEPEIPETSVTERKEPEKKKRDFSLESSYSARYFVIRYTEEGELVRADLEHIASVTSEDVDEYVAVAQKKKEGFGYGNGFKYYVKKDGQGRCMAVFLDCHQELTSVYAVAGLSLLAMVVCVALVFILVVIYSRRAVEPVAQASARQKQFITDASHELKTPLTVITTSLKVLEMETGTSKWIDKIRKQTEKLGELVNALVQLSRLDEDTSPLQMEEMNFSEVTEEVAKSFEDVMAEKGHILKLQIEEGIVCRGDSHGIRQLLSILLDNSVKYAVGETPVTVTLERHKKDICLQVENETAPISEEELSKIFDRFYRVDKARGSKTGGFGIGLSLARSIVEGHGGSIKASMKGNCVCFTATFHS